ncbi:hypothetical protein IAD21_01063 [Abditibacteriota bacterium]|nr:hypothetical protein IAD21_01063 [Abditibacteriota bacterium]
MAKGHLRLRDNLQSYLPQLYVGLEEASSPARTPSQRATVLFQSLSLTFKFSLQHITEQFPLFRLLLKSQRCPTHVLKLIPFL